MLIPPDPASVRRRPASQQSSKAAPPAPMDPEVEAQLRRLRAAQYGRAVRESVARWHKRHRLQKQALLERHQAGSRQNTPRQRNLSNTTIDTAANRPNTSSKQRAEAETSAGRVQPASLAARTQERRASQTAAALGNGRQVQHSAKSTAPQAAMHTTGVAGGAVNNIAMQPEANAAACSQHADCSVGDLQLSSSQQQAQQQQPQAPPASADHMLARLLLAEGSGDPFSIINLYLADCRAAASRSRLHATGLYVRPQQQQQQQQQQAHKSYSNPRRERTDGPNGDMQQQQQQWQQQHPITGPAPEQRPISATSDAENVSSNVRHKRTNSSSVLLSRFDAAADVAATSHSMQQQQQQQQQQHLQWYLHGPDALPSLPEESSKEQYVQEWLLQAGPLACSSEPALSPALPATVTASDINEDASSIEQCASAASTVQPHVHDSTVRSAAAYRVGMTGSQAEEVTQPAGSAASELQLLTSVPMSASCSSQHASSVNKETDQLAGGLHAVSSLAHDISSSIEDNVGITPRSGLEGGHSTLPSQQQQPQQQQLLLPTSISELRRQLDASSSSGSNSSSRSSSSRSEPGSASCPSRSQMPPGAASSEELESDPNHEEAQAPSGAALELSAAAAQLSDLQASAAAVIVQETGELPQNGTGSPQTALSVLVHSEADILSQAASSRPPSGTAADSSEASVSFGDAEISYGDQCQAGVQFLETFCSANARSEAASAKSRASETTASTEVAHSSLPLPAAEQPRSPSSGLLDLTAKPAAHAAHAMTTGAPAAEGADASLPTARPSSPSMLQRLQSDTVARQRPISPQSPCQRPLSPHAADDKYPSPPHSPNHSLMAAAATSISILHDVPPAAQPAKADAAAGWSEALAGEDTITAHSPASITCLDEGMQDLRSPLASLHQKIRLDGEPAEHESGQPAGLDGQVSAVSAAYNAGSSAAVQSPMALTAEAAAELQQGELVSSPPGTPGTVTGEAPNESCPGSAVVEDNTVVQTEEHVQEYLSAVLAYFWAQRTEAYLRGGEPLELEGFLALERSRPACGDPQHIFNKLLWDASNEALAAHYSKTMASFAGRLDPARALLDVQRLERAVTDRVLGWAGMGCGPADWSALLAENAAEEERVLAAPTEAVAQERGAAGSKKLAASHTMISTSLKAQ